jgi:uncharacterized protein YqgC (DUF456 family)
MTLILQKLKVILGLALCVIGLAGTLVPVIPGVPIVLAGIALIGTDHWLVVSVKNWFKRWKDGR